MKKLVLMVVVCLSIVLSGASIASAKAKSSGGSSSNTKSKSVDGTIKMVNASVLALNVPDQNNALILSLSPTTTVTINGQVATVRDLSRGQSVTVAVSGTKVTSITAN